MAKDFFGSKVMIVKAMQKLGKPDIIQHIAKECKMTPQLVKYQIDQMIQWGIVGTVEHPDEPFKTYYMLQPAYYDKGWLQSLYAIFTPYIEALGTMIDTDQAAVTPEQALTRNLTMFLRLFEDQLEKMPQKVTKPFSVPNKVGSDTE